MYQKSNSTINGVIISQKEEPNLNYLKPVVSHSILSFCLNLLYVVL